MFKKKGRISISELREVFKTYEIESKEEQNKYVDDLRERGFRVEWQRASRPVKPKIDVQELWDRCTREIEGIRSAIAQ
jgi:hypothetical protein